jgi:hypothetical protein
MNYNSQKQTENEFFDIVHKADKDHYAMTASCIHPHAGLVTGHAYTILGAIQLSNGVRLVQMRNPWSKERYTGPYNDADPVWTDALAKEAGFTKADDGKMFMPVSDFKVAFTTY